MTQTPHHVAFHEAGHAVAHLRFGRDIYTVTIISDGFAAGSADGDGDFYDDKQCKEHAIALLAGYAAQTKWDSAPSHEPDARAQAGSDFESVERHLRFLGVDEETVVEWARQFVVSEWKTITLIAEQLLERQTLEWDELSMLLEITDGEATMADLEEFREMRAAAMQED